MNRVALFLAAAIYIILFFLLFPWYQFVLDIDAISYIHVAQRYANGDFFSAVNGYWSPLISWILVPFIKAGQDPVLAAKYINGLIGVFALFTCNALLNRFVIHAVFKNILPFIFAGLLLSYAFYELCADLLQLWLLLLYLELLFSRNFVNNNYKIVAAAALAAACYYAKAYSFPFFLVHFPLILYVLLKRTKTGHVRRAFLGRVSLAFFAFFVLTAPYLILLKEKYGTFRINNAGKLNTSWFLSPGISDNRKMVAEPPFVDATSYWDEPTYAQEKYIGAFTSGKFFLVQVKWTISNIIKFFSLMNLISICAVTILLCFIVLLYRRKKDHEANDWLLLLTTMLYPSGYILIFIEWRYIWLLPIALLIMLAILLTWLLDHNYIQRKFFALISLGFSCTFLVQPVNELQDLRYNNKDVYEMADIFRQEKISGNFFLNYKSFGPYGKTVVLSYLTKSKLYGPVLLDYSFDELMQSAKKHNINYYLYFYDFPNEKEMFLQSPYAKAGIRVYEDLYPGLIVVQFK